MSISGCDVSFSQSVRNLDFYLHETLSMDAHIKHLCHVWFCLLGRTGGKNRSFLSSELSFSLTTNRIKFSADKIMQPDLSSVSPGMQMQHHGSERPPGGEQTFSNIRLELSLLKSKTYVTLQWIRPHCSAGSNEEADRLSKMGSKLEQSADHMSCSEAKPILRNKDGVATTLRHPGRRGQHPPAGQSSTSHNL